MSDDRPDRCGCNADDVLPCAACWIAGYNSVHPDASTDERDENEVGER